MSLLDTLMGVLGVKKGEAGAAGGESNPLEGVLSLIQSVEGGLPGLVQKFKDAGLSEQVSSWISTGANLPISAEQIKQALGDSAFGDLAVKLGISTDQVANSLTGLLPNVIDKLTPNGVLEEGQNLLSQGLAALSNLMADKKPG